MASPAQLAARAKFVAMIHAKHGAAPSKAAPSKAAPVTKAASHSMAQQATQGNPHGNVVMMNPFGNANITPPSHGSTPNAANTKKKML